jgi:hypothetical protein
VTLQLRSFTREYLNKARTLSLLKEKKKRKKREKRKEKRGKKEKKKQVHI